MRISPFTTRKTVDKLAVATLPIVSALPAVTAADHGKEVFLSVDEAGNYGGPYLWHCKYRHYKADGVTPSTQTYKWAVISAKSLKHGPLGNGPDASVAADQTGSQAFVDLAVAGPTITVPVAGDYEVDIACAANGAANPIVSVAIGAAAAALGDALWLAGSSSWNSGSRKLTKTLAQGTVLTSKYRSWTGITVSFSARSLFVTPVRIG